MSNVHHRQGDVLMTERPDLSIEKLRADAKLESRNKCVLAEGESTGHAHRIQEAPRGNESIEMFMMGDTKIVYIPESFGTTSVTHEEHAAVTLEPGCHEILIQREYRDGEIVNVAD